MFYNIMYVISLSKCRFEKKVSTNKLQLSSMRFHSLNYEYLVRNYYLANQTLMS